MRTSLRPRLAWMVVAAGEMLEIGRAQSELQSHSDLVCRLLLEKKKKAARIRRRPGHSALTAPTRGLRVSRRRAPGAARAPVRFLGRARPGRDLRTCRTRASCR